MILFIKCKFKNLETHITLIMPVPFLKLYKKLPSLKFNHKEILSLLDEKEKKIFHDHSHFNCNFILLSSDNQNCFTIASITKRRKLPFLYLHYIGNKNVFFNNLNKIRMKLCIKYNCFGIIIDKRFTEGYKINKSISIKLPIPFIYKSDELERKDIDILYSELFILNHL